MSAMTRYAFNDPPLQEQAMNMTSPTTHSSERAALTPSGHQDPADFEALVHALQHPHLVFGDAADPDLVARCELADWEGSAAALKRVLQRSGLTAANALQLLRLAGHSATALASQGDVIYAAPGVPDATLNALTARRGSAPSKWTTTAGCGTTSTPAWTMTTPRSGTAGMTTS